MNSEKNDEMRAHRDPKSGALGAHPVSTGLGAAAGGVAAGAAIGTIAGPVGTVAGASAGAILGGLAGNAIGVVMDPKAEEAHWQRNYSKEPYYQSGLTFDDYSPAYRAGYQGRIQHEGRKFDDVQGSLEKSYESLKAIRSWAGRRPSTRRAPLGIASRERSPATPITTASNGGERQEGESRGSAGLALLRFAFRRPGVRAEVSSFDLLFAAGSTPPSGITIPRGWRRRSTR